MKNVILFERVNSRFDLDDLNRYGKQVILFPDRVPTFFREDKFVEALDKRLRNIKYDPSVDHIVILGRSAYILFAALNMLNDYGCLKILVFDAPNECYKSFTIGDQDVTRQAHKNKATVRIPHNGFHGHSQENARYDDFA